MVKWNYREHAGECNRSDGEGDTGGVDIGCDGEGGGAGVDNKASVLDECASSSDASSTCDEDDDDDDLVTDGGNTGAVVGVNHDERAHFGNIAVKNSTDIHIGNKTFYQGPVTIKQFVYATGKDPAVVQQEGLGGVLGLEQVTTGDLTTVKSLAQLYPDDVTHTPRSIQESQEKGKFFAGLSSPRPRGVVWIVALGVAVTVTLTALLVVFANRATDNNPDATDFPYTGEGTFNQPNSKYNVTLSGKLRVLSRMDWLAQPATAPLDPLHHPVPMVIISHTATENCSSQAQCTYFVRNTQTFHIESKGWSDIGYNFLIGGDGYVYQGRGWDKVGAHTYGYNICSIGISFIGTYLTVHPTQSQFLAAKLLIEQGVNAGKLRPDYQLVAHRQLSATESPGQALFDDLKKLPHWIENPSTCQQLQAGS